MTWERLALIHAAADANTLQKMARVFDYESESQQAFPKQPNHQETHIAVESTSVSPDSAPRPSAKFLRLNKLEQLANSDNSDSKQPSYLYDSSLRLTAESAPKGTYRFAPPRPLFAMPRLLPFLHNSLGQPRAVGRVDFSRLTRLLANAKPVQRLPSLLRRCWPQRLQIVVDTRSSLEPYRSDFAGIIAYFKKLLGAEAITAIRFSEDTLGKANADVIAWPTQSRDTWFTWRVPAADVAILILSDLGVGESHPETRIRWQQFLRHLQAHPAPILTLSPANQSPQSLLQCRQAKPSPLNDTSRLPRHPSRHGFRLPKFDSEKIEEILALLSPLPLIDAGLLRRLRDALQWGSSELESQIWNHPDIQKTSLGIRLHDSVIEKYHQRYQQKFANTLEAAQLWQIVQAHHAEAFEGLRQLETLNRCILEGNDPINTVRSYFQKLNATVMQETDPTKKMTLLMQCHTILDSLPDSVWQSNMDDLAYELYAVSYQDDIRAGRWPEKLKSGFDPTRLQWILDEYTSYAPEYWQVVQTGGQGQFICQRRTRISTNASVPIAVFEAHPIFPPICKFSSDTDHGWRVIHDNQMFSLNNDTISIKTTFQKLELEATGKPDEATSIWRDDDGLFISFPSHDTQIWQVGDESNLGYWKNRLSSDGFDTDTYDVFLCHNPEDKGEVRAIADALIKRGIKPWLDEREVLPGTSWQLTLEEQIANIKSAVIFIGKSGIGPWQNIEIQAFINEFHERECPIIPVILPSAEKIPSLPILLENLNRVDFRVSDPDPLQQLQWGITGKKPNEQKLSTNQESNLGYWRDRFPSDSDGFDTDTYDVFLCHNLEDKYEVRAIADALIKRGIKPWLDEREVLPGTSWQLTLEEQIANIKSAVIFIGKSGIGPWQDMEIRSFINEFIERKCPVIPAILPSTERTPSLPILLRNRNYVDFRVSDPDPLQLLQWGITGKKPDEQKLSTLSEKEKQKIEIKLPNSFDQFSNEKKEELLAPLSALLQTDMEVKIIGTGKGDSTSRNENKNLKDDS